MSGSYSYHHPSFLPWSCPYIPPQQYNTIQSCQPSYPQSPPTSSPWQCPVCPTQEHPVNAVSNLADLTTDSSFPSPYFSPSNNRLTAQVPSQTQAQDTRSISELSPVLGPNSTESRLERIPQLQERISSHQTKVDRLASLLEERIHRLETTHTRADAEAHQQGLQALTQILAEIHDHQVDLPPHPRYQRDPPLTLAEYEREVYQTFSEPPGIRETGSIPDMSNETVDPRVLCSKSPSTPSPPDLVSSQISTDLSGTESLYGEHEEMSSIYNESQALITLESFSQSPESKAEPERAPTADSYHEPSHRRSEADLGYENETETKALSSTVSASKKRGAPLPPTDSVRRLRDRSKTAAPSSLSTDKVPARPATLPKRAKFTTTGRTSSRGTRSLKDLSEKEKGKKKKATPMTYLPYGTLGTSNGVARVPGVNWPKKGPNTVRGVAKDVQCEKVCLDLHPRAPSPPVDLGIWSAANNTVSRKTSLAMCWSERE